MKTFAMKKAFLTSIWAVLAVAALILPAVPNAYAQAPPQDKNNAEVEKQIQALEQIVQGLRRSFHGAEAEEPNSSRPPAETAPAAIAAASSAEQMKDSIARIREEGLNHSQVMQTLSYLTDVIGPRLTGSPALKRANQWSSDKLATWGLANAHMEAWGPFGRGWTLKRFSAQIIEPQDIPLVAYPKAWSPGFDQPITADVVCFDAKTEADLDKYKGKLKGAIVLLGPARGVKAHFEPLALRRTDAELLKMANAVDEGEFPSRRAIPSLTAGNRTNAAEESLPGRIVSYLADMFAQPGPNRNSGFSQADPIPFLTDEGAALVVTTSYIGDGGTIFVASASVPRREGRGNGQSARRVSPWSVDAPAMPAQIVLAVEQYNRLIRMIEQGEKLKMAVDLQVQFHNDDLMAYNTIAEIPGGDLKDEIVMLGGHIDSWHAGTGATDDGAGVAVSMEAVRILKALKLQPRRTIRIALWSGEEQGLLGSEAYVTRHFGEYVEGKLVRQGEYDKLSVYFNFDEGTGKIRGIYMQGNEAVRPIFRRWLEPFKDLGAETLSLDNVHGTDHDSFNSVGLPGFHFIQDPIEYWSRTHHSNADVYDRVQADDMKQAATIMAAFVYNAAMADEKMPRKKLP